ncbi:MAG: DUF1553 domain-containing protein [Verrucomicrobia bacterium]|nr:DUF1553 domain-containing protein [Verrucomicrobiota bacterium]
MPASIVNFRRPYIFALGFVIASFVARGLAAAPREQTVTRVALATLKTECFSCHSQEKKKAGLVLTSRERLLEGSDEGVVVVPGKPEASRLLRALAKDADPHMPPKKQLTEAQIKSIRDWIKTGLAWDAALLNEEESPQPVALAELPASYHPVLALTLAPDGKRIAFGRGGSIFVHDISQTNYPMLAQFNAQRDAVQSLAWSTDGRRLAAGAFRRVTVWEAASFKPEREFTNTLIGRITALRFLEGDRLVATDGIETRSGFVRVFDSADGRLVASWRAHDDSIFDFDVSRDGKQLVTAGGDKLIKVWDLATRKELARLEGHASQVLAVAFNTNATQVASGGADKQLKVWDIATREKVSALGNHSAAVTSVKWPGDGASIVTATDGGGVFTYKNLKAHTGEQSSASGDERKLGETGDAVFCVAMTPDAKTIFAGGQDGMVTVWDNEGKTLAKLSAPTNAAVTQVIAMERRVPIQRDSSQKSTATEIKSISRRSLPTGSIVALDLAPSTIQLDLDFPRHGVLVTARTLDGFEFDATDEARFEVSRAAPFEILPGGGLRALRPGTGTLTAHFRGRRAQIPVTVRGVDSQNSDAAPPSVSFVRDVLPALSKAGCNAGACHAKPEGQNGFKLSVFSYDPKADYAEIVKEDRGRRIFPAAPDESLIIKKPTTALPHEGGLRFERGSETHRLLVRWLREGMNYSVTNEPALERLTVFPKERRYRKGATQRLLVQAHYSDGSVRDVTPLAMFAENDKEIAKADKHGIITIGSLMGQSVVVARYMGFVADAQILVPTERLLPETQYTALPANNFIDPLAYAHFQRLGIFPSELCTDAEFLRRAKLDAIGLLPTPDEVCAFLADPSPDKRRRFIARVLDDPAYADYWANKWADLLRPNPDRVGIKSVFVFDQWLRETFRANKPYDQFVRDILLVEGTNHRDGPAVVYRDRREPPELTTMFSQLFLGTRLECAKCHHHPNEKWSQDDFYQFAAFFGPVKQKGAGLSPPISAGTETFYFAPGGTVKHPVTGAVMPPRPLDGSLTAKESVDPRRALADWLTAPDNPFFARAAVNRVWAVFFGRGLVEPVDDFRISNPCVNPALLTALAEDFARHGYDLKHLLRTIMESRLYQLSSTPNDTNLRDTKNFSRAYRRRLPAEVLLDAVNDVTGVPDAWNALPVGSRATQAWSYKIDSQLMDAFNRPNPSSDPPCERDRQLSVVQSLHLMNSKALQSKLANKTGRAHTLADSSKSPDAIVTELYLAAFSRAPNAEELTRAITAFSTPGATRQSATEDILWSLLNSAEFLFNY